MIRIRMRRKMGMRMRMGIGIGYFYLGGPSSVASLIVCHRSSVMNGMKGCSSLMDCSSTRARIARVEET